MFNWRVEELKLRDSVQKIKSNGYTSYKFSEDRNTSRQDKIEFVDSMNNGKLSYLLNLIDTWKNEKDSLPIDMRGGVKTTSLIAWCKRNDKKLNIIDTSYKYGRFILVGCQRYIQDANKQGLYDTYKDLVDEVFHRQLIECLYQEDIHFKSTDPYEKAKDNIRMYSRKYNTTFDIPLIFCSDNIIKISQPDDKWNGPEITQEQCIVLIDMYDKLEAEINRLSDIASNKFYSHKEA